MAKTSLKKETIKKVADAYGVEFEMNGRPWIVIGFGNEERYPYKVVDIERNQIGFVAGPTFENRV